MLNANGDIIGYTADRTIDKIQLVYNLDSPNLQRQYINIFAEATDTNGVPINLGNSQGKALPVGAKLSNTQDVSAEGLLSACVNNKLSTLTVQLTWTTNKIDDCFYIEVEDYDLKKTANGWQARRRARRMPDLTCNPQAPTVFKNIYARDNKNDKPIPLKQGGINTNISGAAKESGSRFKKNIAKINNTTAEQWLDIDLLNWDVVSQKEIDEAIRVLGQKFFYHGIFLSDASFNSNNFNQVPHEERLKTPHFKDINGDIRVSPELMDFIANLNKLKAAGYTSFEISVSHCCGNSKYLTGSECQAIVEKLYTIFIQKIVIKGYNGKVSDFKRGTINAWQHMGTDDYNAKLEGFHITKVIPIK